MVLLGTFVGALEDLAGLVPDDESDAFFQESVEPGLILLELVLVGASLAALRVFRFPLLVLLAAAVAWYGIVDFLQALFGGGDDRAAALSLIVGLVFVILAMSLDRLETTPYAFWLHVAGGLSVGGAVLWFWHEEDWQWALVAVVALVYVAFARALARSSYAVLGAVGLAATATYFIEKWFSLSSLVPFFQAEPKDVDEWARPLVYLGLGVVFVVLGLLVESRRVPTPPGEPEPAP